MSVDDPNKPEFASWQSYQTFARRVRQVRRYVWNSEIQAFIDTVLATLDDRDVAIPEGVILFRAQQGIQWGSLVDEGGEERPELLGFDRKRMKPLANRATEGRVNPAGIPVLYLASSKQTAISEVRPWIGSEISVAQFKILRDLKAVDLTRGHGQVPLLELTFIGNIASPGAEEKQKLVWMDIDNAFSRPVTRSDDFADYVPTQILAELFRDAGYDAIIYRSQFGEVGYNVALFDLEKAEAINCAPYGVTSIDVKFKEIGAMSFFSTPRGKKNS